MDPPTGDGQNGGQPESREFGHGISTTVYTFLSDYGWFVLIAIAICAYLWQKYVSESWSQYSSTLSQTTTTAAAKKHDDANAVLARHEALLAARQRMQDEQNRLSAIAKEEMAKREEEKRQQKIKEWELHQKGGGYHSKTHQPDEPATSSTSRLNKTQPKKPLRQNDNNPLCGSDGGSSYRPAGRRNFGGGGG